MCSRPVDFENNDNSQVKARKRRGGAQQTMGNVIIMPPKCTLRARGKRSIWNWFRVIDKTNLSNTNSMHSMWCSDPLVNASKHPISNGCWRKAMTQRLTVLATVDATSHATQRRMWSNQQRMAALCHNVPHEWYAIPSAGKRHLAPVKLVGHPQQIWVCPLAPIFMHPTHKNKICGLKMWTMHCSTQVKVEEC